MLRRLLFALSITIASPALADEPDTLAAALERRVEELLKVD